MDINIDKVLTDAQKREAKRALRDWFDIELRRVIQEEVYNLGKEWIKNNKEELAELINKEMKDKIPKVVKNYIEERLRP